MTGPVQPERSPGAAVPSSAGPAPLHPPDQTGRLLALIGAVVVLIVLAAAIAVAALGDRTATYPPGTPEAALQSYLTAYDEGDFETAYTFFSKSVQASMPLRAFKEQASWGMGDPNARISIERTDVTGDRATIHLAVDHYWANGLQSSRSREERAIRLVNEDGAWRIDQQLAGAEIVYK